MEERRRAHRSRTLTSGEGDERRKEERLDRGDIAVADGRWYALVDFHDKVAPVVYLLTSKVADDSMAASNQVSRDLHPNWGKGVPKLQDPWRSSVTVPGFPAGWLEKYRETWEQLPTPVTD